MQYITQKQLIELLEHTLYQKYILYQEGEEKGDLEKRKLKSEGFITALEIVKNCKII